MTTTTLHYSRLDQRRSATYDQMSGSGSDRRTQSHAARLNPHESVLVMTGYFLLLGSMAVVVMTQQFPWFMVAPSLIMLGCAYLRHADKKHGID